MQSAAWGKKSERKFKFIMLTLKIYGVYKWRGRGVESKTSAPLKKTYGGF
jgi:hypothetical protein